MDLTLEALSAYLAGQAANAEFLLQLDLDGFLVIAEETGESCGKRFALLGALWLSRRLLSLALREVSFKLR